MTTNNIFGNDILSENLNTSLVPELGTEDILLNITPQSSSFVDPLEQELSLTQSEVVIDEINTDRNSANNNLAQFNNIAVSNIDPFIAANSEEFQVNAIDINDTSFAPPQSQLEFQGGFGDVDGGNDVTLEIKDTDGKVIETFKLSGAGQASLYRDEEYQYVFFSGVDETTKVDIDSVSNIKFGNYIGDSLEIETTGSIEGGDILLNDSDETGLVLKSGEENSNQGNLGYEIISLNGFSKKFEYSGSSFADVNNLEINNLGQVAGSGNNHILLYDNGKVNNLGSLSLDGNNPTSIGAVNINDLGQIVGYSLYPREGPRSFIYSDGEMSFISPFGADSKSYALDINNLGQVVGTASLNTAIGKDLRAFMVDDGNLSVFEPISFSPFGGRSASRGVSINDRGQIAGWSDDFAPSIYSHQTVLYGDGAGIALGSFDDDGSFNKPFDINNQGQIVGFGKKGNRDLAFLLDPIVAASNSKVTIGNISTFGDTVLLQGNEITLAGNAITTAGGEIEFDGATTVDGNLTIDSSVAEDEVITDGGNITFNNTLNSDSAGTGNLRLQAGTGNILFGNTVGGEATFKNINVRGADIVTATADITSDQLVRINATGDIVTQNITSDNGRVVVSSQEKSISTSDLNTYRLSIKQS